MTKTREELKAKYERELAHLETCERVAAALPADLQPSMIHTNELYGSIGSLVYGDSYSRNNDKVTLEKLADLLAALPPLPMVHAKGTFTRFITEQFADSEANKEKDRETIALIFPVTLKTNSVADFSLKAEWFTLVNGKVWSVDAYLANPYSLAQVSARRIEFKGGFRYENSNLSISDALNPPMGGRWEQVRWGRGSDEYPNDFTAYHCQYDVDPVQWVKDAIASLAEAKAVSQVGF